MSKQAGGDRASTISLLGCSTSVALATGPADRVSTISLLGCSTSVALATGPTDEEDVFY